MGPESKQLHIIDDIAAMLGRSMQQAFVSIYNGVKRINDNHMLVLRELQEEIERICTVCDADALINVALPHASTRNALDTLCARLNVPSSNDIIHGVFVDVARMVYKRPYLVYDEVKRVEYLKNIEELEALSRKTVKRHLKRVVIAVDVMPSYTHDVSKQKYEKNNENYDVGDVGDVGDNDVINQEDATVGGDGNVVADDDKDADDHAENEETVDEVHNIDEDDDGKDGQGEEDDEDDDEDDEDDEDDDEDGEDGEEDDDEDEDEEGGEEESDKEDDEEVGEKEDENEDEEGDKEEGDKGEEGEENEGGEDNEDENEEDTDKIDDAINDDHLKNDANEVIIGEDAKEQHNLVQEISTELINAENNIKTICIMDDDDDDMSRKSGLSGGRSRDVVCKKKLKELKTIKKKLNRSEQPADSFF